VRLKAERREESGSRALEISVDISVRGHWHRLRPEDQAKLFAAFSQVTSRAGQVQEGTGLGLHLSQKLAEALGGRIELKSEYGKGSTFYAGAAGEMSGDENARRRIVGHFQASAAAVLTVFPFSLCNLDCACWPCSPRALRWCVNANPSHEIRTKERLVNNHDACDDRLHRGVDMVEHTMRLMSRTASARRRAKSREHFHS